MITCLQYVRCYAGETLPVILSLVALPNHNSWCTSLKNMYKHWCLRHPASRWLRYECTCACWKSDDIKRTNPISLSTSAACIAQLFWGLQFSHVSSSSSALLSCWAFIRPLKSGTIKTMTAVYTIMQNANKKTPHLFTLNCWLFREATHSR